GHRLEADAVLLQKGADRPAYLVDAGLVAGAAVDVDQLLEQRLHGLALRGKPVQHLALVRGENARVHAVASAMRLCASRAASSIVMKVAPRLRNSSTNP